MSTLLDDIAAATKGKSFKTYKYGFDGIDVPRFDYDDHRHQITWESYGETAYITKPKDMKPLADCVELRVRHVTHLMRFFRCGRIAKK